MNGVNVVGGKTGVLPSIGLDHLLDVEPPRGSGADASVTGQRCTVTLRPGDPRLRLAGGAALQGHAFSHQHLRVKRLDDKTRSSLVRRDKEDDEEGAGVGRGANIVTSKPRGFFSSELKVRSLR